MTNTNTWFIYLLKCQNGSLYTGITTDINKRINAHNTGKGSKACIMNGLPVKLEFSFLVGSASDAAKLEYRIKQLSKTQKLKLIKISQSLDLTQYLIEMMNDLKYFIKHMEPLCGAMSESIQSS